MTTQDGTRRVLVTGAAGKTGLAVIARLAAGSYSGLTIRALGRSAGQRARLEKAGAHEVVVGDFTDRKALARALEGAEATYHICPNVHPEEVAIGRRMIDLANELGTRRFVFHSVLEPKIREMPHHWAKGLVEDLLRRSGLDFTILQPAPYMQNVLAQRSSLVESGFYRVPYDLATRVSMVDLEEVAEVAARILTGAGHSGATYELCAPGLLDQSEIAGTLSRVLGRRVRAKVVPRETWASSAHAGGMPDRQVETLLAMFLYYERSGMSGSHQALEALLGREPTCFAGFAERVFG